MNPSALPGLMRYIPSAVLTKQARGLVLSRMPLPMTLHGDSREASPRVRRSRRKGRRPGRLPLLHAICGLVLLALVPTGAVQAGNDDTPSLVSLRGTVAGRPTTQMTGESPRPLSRASATRAAEDTTAADTLAPPATPPTAPVGLPPAGENAADSLAESLTPLRARPPELLPDTLSPPPPPPGVVRMDRDDWTAFGYKDTGDIVSLLPGLFPRHASLYAEPYYIAPPGGSGRDLLVLYRGRPYNDPVHGAANFSPYAVEEAALLDAAPGWGGSGPSSPGPVLSLHPPFVYPTTPMTRIVYRQGFYGLGHADWRIAQKLNRSFAYHFGLDIGEYEGRYTNSQAATSLLRLGARRDFGPLGSLEIDWMQSRVRHGEPLGSRSLSQHRNDLDLLWAVGDREDPARLETAGWYVRSRRGYGTGEEDGNRLGGRVSLFLRAGRHHLAGRVDYERQAAAFQPIRGFGTPKGERFVGGVTLSDLYTSPTLRAAAGFRGEVGTVGKVNKPGERRLLPMAGGWASFDWGGRGGPGLIGTATRGWRWPALDESYGRWVADPPERLMDPVPLPADAASYTGNGALEPFTGTYAGLGARWRFDGGRSVQLLAGLRRWGGPPEPRETAPGVFSMKPGPSRGGPEITGSGRVPLYGPFSLAGAWTYSEAGDPEAPIPAQWGYGGLRFENLYYDGELRMRVSLNARYWGEWTTTAGRQPAGWVYDGVITAKIFDFEAYWGTNNLLDSTYAFLPGRPMMHRDEIWGVRWVLWD